jgi:valyl-tRNA synthetase
MPLVGLVDIEEERKKLTKQRDDLEKVTRGIAGKLSNENFVNRAPAAVVEGEKAKLSEYTEKLEGIKKLLESL